MSHTLSRKGLSPMRTLSIHLGLASLLLAGVAQTAPEGAKCANQPNTANGDKMPPQGPDVDCFSDEIFVLNGDSLVTDLVATCKNGTNMMPNPADCYLGGIP